VTDANHEEMLNMAESKNSHTIIPESWHAQSAENVQQALATDISGLSQKEARSRLQQYGPNRLTPPKRRGPWLRFLCSFITYCFTS